MELVTIIGALGTVSAMILAYQMVCYTAYVQEQNRSDINHAAHAAA
jgi:hypothetical protein